MTMLEYLRRFTEGTLAQRLREIKSDYEQHIKSVSILQSHGMQRALQLKIDILEEAAQMAEEIGNEH